MDSNKHIIVVDDDKEILEMLEQLLVRQGYTVTVAENAKQLRTLLQDEEKKLAYHLILLDVNLPDGDGVRLAQELRLDKSQIPIMLMTAQGSEEDHILGLEFGADDYIQKPFNFRTLVARINALLRRSSQEVNEPRVIEKDETKSDLGYQFANWTLNIDKRILIDQNDVEISLTKGVYDILLLMVEHSERVLTREFLSSVTKSQGFESFDRAVDVQIARLRSQLEQDPSNPDIIKTVRGVGYSFDAKVTKLNA